MSELTAYAEEHGFKVRKIFRGFESRKVPDMTTFFDSIVKTLLLNMKRINMQVSLHNFDNDKKSDYVKYFYQKAFSSMLRF